MTILQVEEVHKEFGGLMALKNLSLSVPKGGIVSLIGPNGAGKTTLFNCITGTLPAESGNIRYAGHDITRFRPHDVAAMGVARTFQHIRLFKSMTVLQNLLVGNHHRTKTGLASALLRPAWVGREEEESRQKALEILALFKERLLPRINDRADSLSYANQRRLEIARALVSEPDLLLLDEPTAGMNPNETQGIVDLLYELKERGHTVFVIEHKMRVVMTVSDRVIVLDNGEKIAEGTPDEIATNEEVAEAYMGRRDRRASFD